MAALPPKADIRQRIEHVCFVPKADLISVGLRSLISTSQRLFISLPSSLVRQFAFASSSLRKQNT